jgi:hypothetical protein
VSASLLPLFVLCLAALSVACLAALILVKTLILYPCLCVACWLCGFCLLACWPSCLVVVLDSVNACKFLLILGVSLWLGFLTSGWFSGFWLCWYTSVEGLCLGWVLMLILA